MVVIDLEKTSKINLSFPLPYLFIVSAIDTLSNFFKVFSPAKRSLMIFGAILILSNLDINGK